MSINRYMFSLGDGVDSITGAHKGRSIIIPGESREAGYLPEKDMHLAKKASDHKLTPIQSGNTQYEVSIVSDYSDLSQALDLKACLTTALGPNNLSSESSLYKKAKLSKQNVTLLIKGKKIGFVKTMPPNAKATEECVDNLINRRSTFVEAHGDKYVSQVMYGKVIYALISFTNTNQEEALQIKQNVEAKLISRANMSTPASYKTIVSSNHTITDINLEYSGVELNLPCVASNMEDLFAFIDRFNRAELIGAPIDYVSEPYATLIPVREAAELSKQMDMIKGLLSEYDKVYNNIRILIPSIEKLVTGVKHFHLEDAFTKKDVGALPDLLETAKKFKRIMEDLMLEISLNKTDLTCLPQKLSENIILDIPTILVDQDGLDDDTKSANAHKRQYDVWRQLNSILQLCTEAVSNMESEIDFISRQPVAEIVKITPKHNQIYLNLPAGGATIRWDIIFNNDHNDIHSFDIKVKDTNKCVSSYSTMYDHVTSGMEKKINVTSTQRLKITPNEKGDYTIIGSIIGLQALDPNILRHSTYLISKEWNSSKSNEPSKKGVIIAFDGKSSLPKSPEPWLTNLNERLTTLPTIPGGLFFSPIDHSKDSSVEVKKETIKNNM